MLIDVHDSVIADFCHTAGIDLTGDYPTWYVEYEELEAACPGLAKVLLQLAVCIKQAQ